MAAARNLAADSAIALAVCCGCWFASVAYLRSTPNPPTGIAIGALLIAVPAALLCALWVGRNALRARAAAPAAATAAVPVAATAPESLPAIAAVAVRLRGGDSAEALAEALRSNSALCELDGELTDDAGYPVLSGRFEHADPVSAREVMGAWLARHGRGELCFSDEQWRALAMGGAVVAELAQHAMLHPLLPDYLGAAQDERDAVGLPMLHLAALLPGAWRSEQRLAATQWMLHLVEQHGWPAQRLQPAADGADGFSLPAALRAVPGMTLLIACESHLGDDTVRDWHDRGVLFTGRNPRGQIPGEGAAGLLLADDTQAALLPSGSLATLHGACEGRRSESADPRRCELLPSLARQSLKAAQTESDCVAMICSDADMRPDRMGELMSMAHAVLPHLELDAMMNVGATCGSAGAVGPLAALALAAQEARSDGGQVLCVSNTDGHYRCAVLVRAA